jgi:hypothetical protein
MAKTDKEIGDRSDLWSLGKAILTVWIKRGRRMKFGKRFRSKLRLEYSARWADRSEELECYNADMKLYEVRECIRLRFCMKLGDPHIFDTLSSREYLVLL